MNRENPQVLIQKAQKILKPGFFGKVFGSESSRVDEAVGLYQQAANIYKMNKDWENAAMCFENCANLLIKSDEEGAANNYSEAAHCYSFLDKSKQLELLSKCIGVYENKGKFQQAGKMTQKIANDLEIKENSPTFSGIGVGS